MSAAKPAPLVIHGWTVFAHPLFLAQLETLDNGKPIKFARGEIFASAGAIRYFAGWVDKIHGSTHNVNMPGDYHVYTLKEPVGVVALIVPWNYPIVMAAMKLGPALAAGCTCVLKPAEDTSLSAIRLGEIMLEAGLPEGVVNIVTGLGHTVGAALASHQDVNKIAFTGSTATGKVIAQIAAAGLILCWRMPILRRPFRPRRWEFSSTAVKLARPPRGFMCMKVSLTL